MASFLPSGWEESIEDKEVLIQPVREESGTEMVKDLITFNLIPIFKYVFIAISILFFSLSLFIIATASGDDDLIGKHKTTILWSLLGFALISLSAEIAQVFNPLDHPGEVANVEGAKTAFQKVIAYLQLALGIVSITTIFYAGFRLVVKGDDDDTISKQKKHIAWAIAGLAIAILADPLINGVFYPASGAPGEQEVKTFAMQIIGVIKFALSFLGILAFAGFIFAGVLFVTSFGDEERHNKAKEIIIGSVIGIVIILSSFALINAFVPTGG